MKRKPRQRRTQNTPQPLGPIDTYHVDNLTHEAKGVARQAGKVTFIDGALPGETVLAQVCKSGRRFDEARLVEILLPAAERIEPKCAHYAQCGGCRFQHLAYPQQIDTKRTWLLAQLRNVNVTSDISILANDAFGYRRRARLSVRVKGDSLQLGFRSQASSNIVDIKQCPVLTSSLESLILPLRQQLAGCQQAKAIGHIELLEDALGVAMVLRLTDSLVEAERQSWIKFANAQGVTLYWQDKNADRASLDNQPMRQYVLDDLTLTYHPQDFIQVNAAMNVKMVAQALAWLSPQSDDVILDLFCGTGNFSLPLAKAAKQVIGIELQESMVVNARANSEANQQHNIEFMAADLTQPIAKGSLRHDITKVLLDPPRAGAFEFLPSIIALAPQKILYVSCNASTLARDAEFLVANGYYVEQVALMEMFPQTAHVETMMLLRKSSKQKR